MDPAFPALVDNIHILVRVCLHLEARAVDGGEQLAARSGLWCALTFVQMAECDNFESNFINRARTSVQRTPSAGFFTAVCVPLPQ